MALISFTSDFGDQDHYVAAVKAAILSVNPALRVLDISHRVPNCHIGHGAMLLRSLYKNFAPGSVHLVAVGSDSCPEEPPYLALQLDGHFFVGANNGLFSLVSDLPPTVSVDLKSLPQHAGTFVAKNKLASAAAMLASGRSIHDLGTTLSSYHTLTNKKCRYKNNQLQGHIIHVDRVGNLISNLSKKDFDAAMQRDHSSFEIIIGKERSTTLHTHYNDIEGGECFFLFNDYGLLEIGILHGSANALLGMKRDSPICIQFS